MQKENILTRMKEDMLLRGFAPSTQGNYLRYAGKFLDYAGRPVTELNEQEIRKYLTHLLTEKGLSRGTVNMYNAALRFLFEVTLNRTLNHRQVPRLREIRRIPCILSKEELRHIFTHTDTLQYKAMFMTLYGSGLRLSEVCKLRVCDIDSKNMRIFVNQSKNGKDRYTILSQANLEILREYWREYRPQHPDGWLFLNKNGSTHAKKRTIQKAFDRAKDRAGIEGSASQATIHTLRHCFATHLLEDGVDFFTVKQLLGHVGMESTTRYARLMKLSPSLKSPLDSLPKKRGRKPKSAATEILGNA